MGYMRLHKNNHNRVSKIHRHRTLGPDYNDGINPTSDIDPPLDLLRLLHVLLRVVLLVSPGWSGHALALALAVVITGGFGRLHYWLIT